MECMCAQTRPRFILSSERVVGNGVRTHANTKGKIPSTGGPEQDGTRDAASRRTASPAHYPLSYSGPFYSGHFYSGPFYSGPFYSGPFYSGPFYSGSFYSGPFYSGPFYSGPFYSGPFYSGSFYSGPFCGTITFPCERRLQ